MTVSTRVGIIQNLAKGMGQVMPQQSTGVAGTAAAASSGYFTCGLRINALGTTQPGTLVSLLSKDDATNQMLSVFNSSCATSSARNTYFGRFYRIGSVDLTATGNKFTHDAATFPVNRTIMGQTSALNLIPVVYVTTALTVTASQFIIRNSAPSAGYKNQTGSSITGTQTFVFPSATTAAGSAYIPMLESGDSSIQDIINVNVTVASTVGAFDIYGFEPLMLSASQSAPSYPATHNAAIGAMTFTDTKPATATSGTATSYLGYLSLGVDVANTLAGLDILVNNQ